MPHPLKSEQGIYYQGTFKVYIILSIPKNLSLIYVSTASAVSFGGSEHKIQLENIRKAPTNLLRKINVTTTKEFAFIHDYNNFSSFGVKIWNNKNSEHESASIVIKQPIKTVTIFIRNKRYQFRCGLCGFSRWQHIFVIQVNYWLRITDLQQLFHTASWETPTFTDHWPTFMFSWLFNIFC